MKHLLQALPEKKRKEIKVWFFVSTISFSLATTFIVFIFAFDISDLRSSRSQFLSLSYDVGDFDIGLKTKKNLQKDKAALETELKKIQSYAANGSKIAMAMLSSVCKVIPEQIFLEKLDFDYKTQVLELFGYCQDIFLLTHFVDKFSEFDFCKNVRLQKISKSTLENYPLQFVISIKLKEI